jgi:hypothetical protein
VIVDLIMQGVTIVLVIYFALHLRTQIRTVKSTVEAQKATIDAQAEQMKALKATIDAQAEQMKAQSMVLQDVERFYKIMQEVQLQREQAHRAMVERDAATLTLLRERFATWYAAVDREDFEWQQFATSVAYATLRDDLPEDLRQEIDLLRNPRNVLVPATGGVDHLRVCLLDEIAAIERRRARLMLPQEALDEMPPPHHVQAQPQS